jgi:hypothetical protein
MTPDEFQAYIIANGYPFVRQLPDGRWIGVSLFIYTVGLCVELDAFSYRYRYCYAYLKDAHAALTTWDGTGDPPGPWIKLKGHPTRGDVLGPGAKDHIEGDE